MTNKTAVTIAGVQGFKPRAPLPVRELGELKTKSFQSVTVSSTAIGLTPPVYNELFRQSKAVISVESADVRVRTDGTAPTSTVGHLINQGDVVTLDSYADILNFKAIRTGSTDAKLQVTILEVVHENN